MVLAQFRWPMLPGCTQRADDQVNIWIWMNMLALDLLCRLKNDTCFVMFCMFRWNENCYFLSLCLGNLQATVPAQSFLHEPGEWVRAEYSRRAIAHLVITLEDFTKKPGSGSDMLYYLICYVPFTVFAWVFRSQTFWPQEKALKGQEVEAKGRIWRCCVCQIVDALITTMQNAVW